jgi:hypothetical protein
MGFDIQGVGVWAHMLLSWVMESRELVGAMMHQTIV